jgi:hypothetical protein
LAAAVALVLSASCGERIYGVQRAAKLSAFPDPACVRAVVETVSGTEGIDEWHWPQRRREGEYYAHHLSYAEDEVRVQLAVFDEGPGRVRFVQAYLSVDEPLPEAEVEVARRLMIAVEDGLVSRCGQAELRARVRETCEGEGCE